MNREEGAYMDQLIKKNLTETNVRTLKSNLEDYKKRLKFQYDLQIEVSKRLIFFILNMIVCLQVEKNAWINL